MKKPFKDLEVGDRVVCAEPSGSGSVVLADADSVCVEFDEPKDWMHAGPFCDGRRTCWYVGLDQFEKLKPTRKAPKGTQAYKGNGKHKYEPVTPDSFVQRLRVPGGWIYRDDFNGALVFVPVPSVVGYPI